MSQEEKRAGWARSETWRKRGDGFCVEVKHWVRPADPSDPARYPETHHWNTYIFVYPKHPTFPRFNTTDKMWEQHCPVEFHGGVTYFRAHLDAETGGVTSYQLGDDYAHCDDERFECYATMEDAWEVFADAEGHHETLQSIFDNVKRMSDLTKSPLDIAQRTTQP